MAGSDNLTPWQPGQSGNPKGKPKGSRNRETIVREILEATMMGETVSGLKHHMPVVEAMVHAVAAKVLADGNVQGLHELLNSAYGKLTDKVENAHTFQKMETIKIGTDAIENQPEKPLTFDIGTTATQPADDDNPS